jgi:hypothetical protein
MDQRFNMNIFGINIFGKNFIYKGAKKEPVPPLDIIKLLISKKKTKQILL